MEEVEEGEGMTVEHVTEKESETGEIHETGWLKMQSENLNEDIENESEKQNHIQPQEQSEHRYDGRKGENINTKEEWNGDKIVGKEECLRTSEFSEIKMPPKMMKRRRPKGAEVTVIGMPKAKKRKVDGPILLPFQKLKPCEKERVILECITKNRVVAAEALNGRRLLGDEDIETNIHLIPDTVRDTEKIDIFRIEKYFGQDTWLKVLQQIQKKEEVPWQCKMCNKAIKSNQESIACDRCLLWYHFLCSSLSSKPKSRNWFCKCCKNKFK